LCLDEYRLLPILQLCQGFYKNHVFCYKHIYINILYDLSSAFISIIIKNICRFLTFFNTQDVVFRISTKDSGFIHILLTFNRELLLLSFESKKELIMNILICNTEP